MDTQIGQDRHAASPQAHLQATEDVGRCCALPRPQSKRLPAQMSEETDDNASVSSLAAVEQHLRAALNGSPLAKKPKTLHGGDVPHLPPAAAADNSPAQQGLTPGSLPAAMGPPPLAPTAGPRLGSLLVAAQMASGGSAAGGVRGADSPLLPATQATLRATTACVIAAEVLAAVSSMPAPSAAQANTSSSCPVAASAALVAGLLSGASLSHGAGLKQVVTKVAAMQPATPSVVQQQQQQQRQGDTPATLPTAGAAAAAGSPRCSMQDASPAAHASTALQDSPPSAQQQVDLPTWLREPSAELQAGQAICKASLATATAALARLSSPRGLCLLTAAAAAGAAAGGVGSPSMHAGGLSGLSVTAAGPPSGGGVLHSSMVLHPGPAFAAGVLGSSSDHWAAAAAGAMQPPGAPFGRSPATSPVLSAQSPQVPVLMAAGAVVGVPAREPPGPGVAWGLPVSPAPAAAAAARGAFQQGCQPCTPAAAAAAGGPGAQLVQLPALRTLSSEAPDCQMVDAGSCSSTPRAAAVTPAGAGAAAAAAAGLRAAAVAAKLGVYQRQQQGCSPCSGGGCNSAALTADDASSPLTAAADVDEVSSGLSVDCAGGNAAAGGDDAAAATVVVHVAITRGKRGQCGGQVLQQPLRS